MNYFSKLVVDMYRSRLLVLILVFLIFCSCSLSGVGYLLVPSSDPSPDPSPGPSPGPSPDPSPDPSIACEGYYSNPVCPHGCGLAATTLQKTWITTNQPTDITSCPSPSTKSCPATAECMAYDTYYASNIPFEGAPGTFSYHRHDPMPLNQSAHLCAKKCNSNADCKGFNVTTTRCVLHKNDASKPRNRAGRLYCDHPNVRYNFRKSSTPPNNICTYLYSERKPNPTTHFPRYP